MQFISLAVVLLMYCKTKIIAQDVCNDNKIFRGTARNSDAISHAMSDVLNGEFHSMCDAGVQCGHYCMGDSLQWNYFEVREVSPLFPLTFNSGIGEGDHVLLVMLFLMPSPMCLTANFTQCVTPAFSVGTIAWVTLRSGIFWKLEKSVLFFH